MDTKSTTSNLFDFPLNAQQEVVFNALKRFTNEDINKVFILRGYAGTGKTSLMSGLIKWMENNSISYTLLASTGRAAKILSDKTGAKTRTIHSHIYVFKNLSEDLESLSKHKNQMDIDDAGQLSLMFEMRTIDASPGKLYIVDEASMISDIKAKSISFARFGSEELLSDLLKFDQRGKFIFVGDPIQLPPVNQSFSPALSREYIENKFKCRVIDYKLTDIIRQDSGSGIVSASMDLRRLYKNNPPVKFARFQFKNYPDIQIHSSHTSLINCYIDKIKEHGFEYSTLLCQTNRFCCDINKYIRNALNKNENRIEPGDLLMVTQNNYLTDLVNGDIVEVLQTGETELRSGMSFRQVQVRELAQKEIVNIRLIEDILYSVNTNLDNVQNRDLMIDYFMRMKSRGIEQKDELFKTKMMSDPYLNALKAVYGYALTCHKSQGGEWEEVFLYLDNKIHGLPKPSIYQWMYTAITRAKSKIHVVDDWFIV
jgi:ATP-dependent exoDNAse (exonuclease V) alpha subunit